MLLALEHQAKRFAVGLAWHTLGETDKGAQKEIERLAREIDPEGRFTFGVRLKGEGSSSVTESVGFVQAEIPSMKPPKQLYSLASAISKAGVEGIFILGVDPMQWAPDYEPIESDEQLWWYCRIADGMVVAEHVGPREEMIDKARDELAYHAEGVPPVIHGEGLQDAFDEFEEVNPLDYVSSDEPGPVVTQLVGLPLRKIATAGLALAVIAVLGVGTLGVMSYLDSRKPSQPVHQMTPEEFAAQQRQMMYASIANTLGTSAHAYESDWASQARLRIERLAVDAGGWSFGGAMCGVVEGCTYQWKSEGATYTDVLETALGLNVGTLYVTSDGLRAILTEPAPLPKSDALGEEFYRSLPAKNMYERGLVEIMKRFEESSSRYKWSLTPASKVEGVQVAPGESPILAGTLAISGNSIDLLTTTLLAAERLNLAVRKFTYNPYSIANPETKWDLEFVYAAK